MSDATPPVTGPLWTVTRNRTTLVWVEPQQLHALIEKLTAGTGGLVELAQLEIALRGPGTDSAATFEKLAPDLEALQHHAGELAVFQAITDLPDRCEPYRVSEIAELLGADTDTVRRVLAWMITQQLADTE